MPNQDDVDDCDNFLAKLDLDIHFHHINAQLDLENVFHLFMVVDLETGALVTDKIEQEQLIKPAISVHSTRNVELLSLHGPHFQDRYGIANAAYTLLDEHNLQLLSSSCTGTSLNLVFPENSGEKAGKCLEKTFVVP